MHLEPAGHGVHVAAPEALLKVPFTHGRLAPRGPWGQNVPGAQTKHPERPAAEKCPGGQSSGGWSCIVQLKPAGHTRHAVDPPRLYLPAAHGTGACEAVAHECPAGHVRHCFSSPIL